ncbi:MAG: ATP-binding protein [Roseburia sp.]|nr:ATP-binding protein [Roseburia sp.]
MGDKKGRKKKKTTIFRIFLIPLIGIMLVQSIITIGMLVIRRTMATLDEYSIGMMGRVVENRRVILQNDMNQRWTSVRERETLVTGLLEQILADRNVGPEEFLESEEMKSELLERLFPECLNILESNATTGIFIVLTGDTDSMDFDGFFIRDSDPDTSPANYTDLLLERGSKNLSRRWNIPLDTHWTTRFHMDGWGQNAADGYFYEPWRAGLKHPEADTKDLGYWSAPFTLAKDPSDSYEMITYSLPLRYEGRVYGVLGIEVSVRRLHEYFPIAELNDSQQSGYMLAVRQQDGSYAPLAGRGVLYNLVRTGNERFLLRETEYDTISLIEDIILEDQRIYAVMHPLKLYSNNVPYEDTEWVLLGLETENELFGMSRQLYVWMVVAILIGLIFGVFGIYFLVRHLTRPVQYLMSCISRGRAGLQEFKPSNILEIDALYDVVNDLTDRQKEAENILLEEKERYRVALESSRDIFFSYDIQSHTLDIVNHATKGGERENGVINPDYIYEEDRAAVLGVMQNNSDKLSVEFRMKWPDESDYAWVALSGNVVYDTDGERRKLVGSIRNIQEQKEKEAEQLRKTTIDGVTGLYAFGAGLERLKECRKMRSEGVMVNLFLNRLRETNEKNGIVFGDMLLEEIGRLTRESCKALDEASCWRTVALRLDGDELVLWLEMQSRKQATAFIEDLLEKIAANFEEEVFRVEVHAGLVCAEKGQSAEKLITMAKQARRAVIPDVTAQYMFYEDLPKKKRMNLPILQAREVSTLNYGGDVNLASLALNLFGRGADFPAQMLLLIRKTGRAYRADGVLVSVLRADFNANYLEYQWYEDGRSVAENVRSYKEEDRAAFLSWLGREEILYVSAEESAQALLQCFLSIPAGQCGVVLPMYDNGSYMGNICILGVGKELLENPEEYQNLAELGRVIQGQMNQRQHDIASKAKSDFLSRMSHEIRTPMNGIIGMTAIALQQDQKQERIMDCLQKIQSSSNYLLGLINDILDMSKIESGKMKLEPMNFDIHEMLDTIRELIQPQAAAKSIVLEQDIRLTHNRFVADKLRVSQVLINLLGNAVKFTPENGRIALTVREETPEDAGSGNGEAVLYFAVRDTGIGIAKEDQERVFRSFEQAAGMSPSKQRGTGLGLSISSRLIQMMGSNIQLESEPGEGSTFSFSIRLELGEDVQDEVQEEEISFDGMRILVVEDNELNAEIAQTLLEERNFKVDCVFNGQEAVERIRDTEPNTYDVILMDIMMPVMDGLEATRAIRSMKREDCATLPIVAMSANAFDDDLKKSVECGMNGHLSKPVEVEKLYRTLSEVIRANRK